MHRWIVVNKDNLQIMTSYDSEARREFGGPWANEEKFVHLQVPEELHDVPGLVVSYEQGIVSVEFTECLCAKGNPIFKEAYDKNGNLLVDPQGAPMYAKLYQKQETLGMVYKIRAAQ
jgi:hypothetical protein